MALVSATLRTLRLQLRRWSLADLDEVMAAIEASIDLLQPWMQWAADGVPSRAAELQAFEAGIADFDRDADWQFSLFESHGGALVGGCGLHRTGSADQLEIGYWTHADRQRRGYATEAAAALVEMTFTSFEWVQEVLVRMDIANPASARVPEVVTDRAERPE